VAASVYWPATLLPLDTWNPAAFIDRPQAVRIIIPYISAETGTDYIWTGAVSVVTHIGTPAGDILRTVIATNFWFLGLSILHNHAAQPRQPYYQASVTITLGHRV